VVPQNASGLNAQCYTYVPNGNALTIVGCDESHFSDRTLFLLTLVTKTDLRCHA